MQPVLAYPGSGLLCTFLPLQQCTLIQQCMLIQQSCLCSFNHFSCCCTNAKAVCLVSRPQYQGPQPLSLLSTQALVVMAHCADVSFFASDHTSPMWPCLDVAIIARRFGYIQQFISSICHAQPFMQKRQQQHCWHAASAGGWPIIGRELYMGRAPFCTSYTQFQGDMSCCHSLVGFAVMQQVCALACRPSSTSRLRPTYKGHSRTGCRYASQTGVACVCCDMGALGVCCCTGSLSVCCHMGARSLHVRVSSVAEAMTGCRCAVTFACSLARVPKPHGNLHCCNSDHMGFLQIDLCVWMTLAPTQKA